ncbi:hypothetical protein GUITHDRAFT_111002 [Guillardia theta CCMP2712]|uniref:Uncharacterized protein n=1 Tax=Guillardia theta (strain CCMP2712) TaxID=905079 RepID=L1J490_GUITC|nr:hypothetical protein GUITHDRAFT_111002 [Guillardia theta CCMP2712]EKX42954.1 hypothetical protein GUITHDRAFT_111002 [Guillardia theta CCMP2712]|eukprot:XP_005829934.1 hypothetical protein GUITHDRAFT_111002 [Guillardia theta CCMP2712]
MLGSVEQGIAKMAGLERSWRKRWERAKAPLAAMLSLRAEMLAEIREEMERREEDVLVGCFHEEERWDQGIGEKERGRTDPDLGIEGADRSFEEEARDMVDQLLAQKKVYEDTAERLGIDAQPDGQSATGKDSDLVWRPTDERCRMMRKKEMHPFAPSPPAAGHTDAYGGTAGAEDEGVAPNQDKEAMTPQLSCSLCPPPGSSRTRERIRQKLLDLDESLRSTRREIDMEQGELLAPSNTSPSFLRGRANSRSSAAGKSEHSMLVRNEESVRSVCADEEGEEDLLLDMEKTLSEYCDEMSGLRGRVQSLLVERRSFLGLSDVLRDKNRQLELERRRLQSMLDGERSKVQAAADRQSSVREAEEELGESRKLKVCCSRGESLASSTFCKERTQAEGCAT